MSLQQVAIIGGGAAGLIAAGRVGELGLKAILFEKNKVLGRKVLISGKGRCNVTNDGDIETFMKNYNGKGRFLYSSFNKFFNNDLKILLNKYGVELKVERGERIFPVSDKAQDIVTALTSYVQAGAAEIRNEEVVEIVQEEGAIKGVRTANKFVECSAVIVATGGKSYSATGSTGDGYKWATEIGHTVITPRPALVPLNIMDDWVKELQGLALKNIEVTLWKEKKLLAKEFGEMLFTHFGVSGPIILTLSRRVVEDNSKKGMYLTINLKPALDEEKLDNRLQRDFKKYQRKQLRNALDDLLPQRLIPVVIAQSDVSADKFVHQVTKEDRKRLINTLKALKMTVLGTRSLAEAIVTAGGVNLKEVNPKTMESKLVKGLYFAGEVLDIDGNTGGYNLQAAFSTGYLAGESSTLEQ
ncbi:MAG: NAD(P)/FAD-dependent oxidoreductase [Clostridia bacterium]|nr:NAD(P)/FAD-dependent oxidoreductase [Clostridia bacterium]MDD4048932.1 NAD(P)/FAD-dependent oxidoreductase [Clostridia bacterium]